MPGPPLDYQSFVPRLSCHPKCAHASLRLTFSFWLTLLLGYGLVAWWKPLTYTRFPFVLSLILFVLLAAAVVYAGLSMERHERPAYMAVALYLSIGTAAVVLGYLFRPVY